MNTQEWIDSLGLEEGDKGVLKGIAAKKPDAFNGHLAHADYTKKTMELADLRKKQEQEFADKDANLKSYRETLIQTRGKIDTEYTRMKNERDDLERKLTQTGEQIRKLADEQGIDLQASGLNLDLPPANGNGGGARPKTEPARDPVDTSKFVDRDAYIDDQMGHSLLVAKFNDLVEETRELTGKPVRDTYALMEEAVNALKSGKPQKIDEMFDRRYNLGELRKQREDAAAKEREDAIRRDERDRVLSEQLVNSASGNPRTGSQSPALRFAEGEAAKKVPSGVPTPVNRRLQTAQHLEEEARKASL